ncbi:hypothetical protein B0I37DRAFT_381978 [Chaetomium sp. MPI-CAGE-AT-0009]|nr:hypothetical protein B0I37DRAFT_381978 [Chaetomium sp. MPI-CAGE-AT-0009]
MPMSDTKLGIGLRTLHSRFPPCCSPPSASNTPCFCPPPLVDPLPRNPMRVLQYPFIFHGLQGIPCPRLALVQLLSGEQSLWPIELFLRRGQGSADAVNAVEIAFFDRPKQRLAEEVIFIPGMAKLVHHALGDAALDLVQEALCVGIGRGCMERRVLH